MKKKVILLIFAMLIVLGLFFKDFIFTVVSPKPAVTPRGLNITIDSYPPDLIVYSPISTEYSDNRLEIKYSVSDSGSGIDTVWYNLDGGQNITLAGDTTITVSKGKHILYVYARDKARLVNDTEFVTFSVK